MYSLSNITLQVPGKVLLDKTEFKLAPGHKYGFLGKNGIGKTSLLKFIHNKIQTTTENSIIYLEQEAEASDTETVLEHVLSANPDRMALIKAFNELENKDLTDEDLEEYNRLAEEMAAKGVDKDESIVKKILHGLGFLSQEYDNPTSSFSGGWRMRLSMAKALYMEPDFLFLDEPTNHLDLNATIWLTDYLANSWSNTLLVISHNKNFLNEVCTNTMTIYKQKILYYRGNYRKYLKARGSDMKEEEKKWTNLEKQVKGMRKKGTPKKNVQEFLSKHEHEKPEKPYTVNIEFMETPTVKGDLLRFDSVNFGYTPDKQIYNNLSFTIQPDARITVVGPNGVGKSTLLKLIYGTVEPTGKGSGVWRNHSLRIGYYHQHASEALPLDSAPVDYLQSLNSNLEMQECRQILGKIGLEGKSHVKPMATFSGGQKARVMFAGLTVSRPHLLLLDEPTNHLDIESTQALIEAINEYDGAVIMVTHDVDLIEDTESELWEILTDGTVNITDMEEYTNRLLEDIN